jgi:hypothetical protein
MFFSELSDLPGAWLALCPHLFFEVAMLSKKLPLVLFAVLLVQSPSIEAQKISPVISEYGGKVAKGQLTDSSNSLLPESVVIEARSFSVVNGKTTVRPLDAGVTISLSQTSARLSPNQSIQIDYVLHCAQNCAVVLLSSFSGIHITTSISTDIVLPYSIYFCANSKAKDCRKRIRASWGATD